jgi:hypothetical protein
MSASAALRLRPPVALGADLASPDAAVILAPVLPRKVANEVCASIVFFLTGGHYEDKDTLLVYFSDAVRLYYTYHLFERATGVAGQNCHEVVVILRCS